MRSDTPHRVEIGERRWPTTPVLATGLRRANGGDGHGRAAPGLPNNWLQVLDTAERTQIYQRVRHQFHAVVSLLDAFKAEQQPLELVLPGKGPLNPQA